MYLHRIFLNARCREARRDLADPYQLHATLCRAFSSPESRCDPGEFLWRIEPEIDSAGTSCILVQGRSIADWSAITVKGWLARSDVPVDLKERLKLDSLRVGQEFRFRLRANPSVTQKGKRRGLHSRADQEQWFARKGDQHGFSLSPPSSDQKSLSTAGHPGIIISEEQMMHGKQQSGNGIVLFSVLFDGVLSVTKPEIFKTALENGIGHGKAMGLGLLSVARIQAPFVDSKG